MKINLAAWDRILRSIFGFFFSTWAIAGGPWWSYAGIYLIISAAWGLCPVYGLFKIRTHHDKAQRQSIGKTPA